MTTTDQAHLAAMGVPPPPNTSIPVPDALHLRIRALDIRRMRAIIAGIYQERRSQAGFDEIEVQAAFEAVRRRHKAIQEVHNVIQGEYMTRLRSYGNPPRR